MENLKFYNKYLSYLNWKLKEGKITKGAFSLFKISEPEYNRFLKRLENDESFNKKITNIIKSENRENNINEIIKNKKNSPNDDYKNLDDFFDEFDI